MREREEVIGVEKDRRGLSFESSLCLCMPCRLSCTLLSTALHNTALLCAAMPLVHAYTQAVVLHCASGVLVITASVLSCPAPFHTDLIWVDSSCSIHFGSIVCCTVPSYRIVSYNHTVRDGTTYFTWCTL